MSDLDLELLQAWSPEPITASPEVREHARATLEQEYGPGMPTTRRAPATRRFGKRFAIAALAAAAVLAGGAVWLERAVDDRVDDIKTVTVPGDALGGGEIGKGPVNILLVGSDRRDGTNPEAFGTPAESGPPRSDTMILLRIDGDAVRALWIPRDLVVGEGPDGRINAAFSRGAQSLVDTITTTLGVTVDHYVEVEFSGFERIVDTVGGVKMYFPGPVRDSYSGLDIAGAGCQTLDGRMALSWVRSRHAELLGEDGTWNGVLSERADLDRLSHQQEFFRALARQLRLRVDGDPAAAVRLVDALIPALVIDSEFSRAEILGLVRALIDVDPAGLQLGTIPVQAAPDGARVVLVQPAAEQALAPFKGAAAPPPSPAPVVPATAPVHDC